MRGRAPPTAVARAGRARRRAPMVHGGAGGRAERHGRPRPPRRAHAFFFARPAPLLALAVYPPLQIRTLKLAMRHDAATGGRKSGGGESCAASNRHSHSSPRLPPASRPRAPPLPYLATCRSRPARTASSASWRPRPRRRPSSPKRAPVGRPWAVCGGMATLSTKGEGRARRRGRARALIGALPSHHSPSQSRAPPRGQSRRRSRARHVSRGPGVGARASGGRRGDRGRGPRPVARS